MKKNQYIPEKRRPISSNAKLKQTSQKKKIIRNNLEGINYSVEMIKWKIKNDFLCKMMVLGLEAVIMVAMIIVFQFIGKTEDQADNVIVRHYTEIMKHMDDEPKDISLYQYQAKIPKTVQEDIDKMLEMGEGASILYYNDQGAKIIIEPSEDSESGYKVRFKQRDGEDSSLNINNDELESNVSFYKAKDTLIIYGSESRRLRRYYIDNYKIDYDSLENEYVDLYGTNAKYDDIRTDTSYFTLIRKDIEFSFYHLGEKVYTTNFPGGEIYDWSRYYLLTTSKECYNVYYSGNLQDYWIKFYKVAENVDEVLQDEQITVMDEEGIERDFPILKIGNKKYAQIPNLATERRYEQQMYRRKNNEKNFEVNFTSKLVELSASNSSKVKLKCTGSYNGGEWILYYYFQVDDRECFFKKRINGLDDKISGSIPEEKIEKFNGKVISPDEVEKYINRLRLLYDEYTDNKF